MIVCLQTRNLYLSGPQGDPRHRYGYLDLKPLGPTTTGPPDPHGDALVAPAKLKREKTQLGIDRASDKALAIGVNIDRRAGIV